MISIGNNELITLLDSVIAHDFLDQQAMRCMDEEAWNKWLENKKTYTSTLLQNIASYTQKMAKDRDDIVQHITGK
jgi:hypothetical protein